MDTIMNRRSIRKYTDVKISDAVMTDLLKAAMAAPSAGNGQPWEFVVIRDKEIMKSITEVHPYSKMLLSADAAIVVCGNLDRELYKGFWVQDCSAATENILLAATAKGVGSVWLGVYPSEERCQQIADLLGLPANIKPLSIISLGYPAEEKKPENRFDESRIHNNRW